MKTKFWGAVAVAAGVVAFGTPAKADTLQISCAGCAAGGIQTTSNQNPTLSINTADNKGSGTLFLAILIPTGSPSVTFTVNSTAVDAGASFTTDTLWSALGETGGSDHNFSATTSFSFPPPSGYTVFDVSLGSFTGGTPVTVNSIFTVGSGFANGTQFVAFLEDNSDQVINVTPLSESLQISGAPGPGPSAVPEPGTLLLFGSGLLGLAGVVRRRLGA